MQNLLVYKTQLASDYKSYQQGVYSDWSIIVLSAKLDRI